MHTVRHCAGVGLVNAYATAAPGECGHQHRSLSVALAALAGIRAEREAVS